MNSAGNNPSVTLRVPAPLKGEGDRLRWWGSPDETPPRPSAQVELLSPQRRENSQILQRKQWKRAVLLDCRHILFHWMDRNGRRLPVPDLLKNHYTV